MLFNVLFVLHCFAICVTRAQLSDNQLAVHWSFDNSVDRILPSKHDTTLFDASEIDFEIDTDDSVLEAGFAGNGLRIRRQVDLAENVRRPCLDRLDLCGDFGGGLTLAFWIKLHEWNSNSFQTVIRTTTATKSLPGIFVGKSTENDNIEVFFWDGGEDQEYTAEFALGFEMGTHVVITWTADDGLKVALNGTFLAPEEYTAGPSQVSRTGSTRSIVDVISGSNLRPVFTLDEIYVFYRVVNQSEIDYMSGSATTEETTTTEVSTTSTETPLNTTTTTASTTSSATPGTTTITETATTPTSPTSPTSPTTPVSTTTSATPGDCPFDFQEAWEEYTVNMQKWKEAFEEYQASEGETPTC